jgi:hypothetical protein
VGAPGEALAPALLLGFAFGAFFASRVLAAADRFGGPTEHVRTPREAGRGAVGAGPAPPPPAAGPEEVGRWLAGREDLALFAPEEVAALPGALEAGERVTGVGLGSRDGVGGLLAVTDRRLLFLRKGGAVDALPLASVVSATVRKGTILGTLTIEHAGGAATFEVAGPALAGVAGALGVPLRAPTEPPAAPTEGPPGAPSEGPPAAPTEGPGNGR